MSHNPDLTGPIPADLGRLSSLSSLRLHVSGLSGQIPTELGELTDLTELWLQDSGLEGPIPSELGGLTDLIFLFMSDNELTGSIPSELGDITNLSHLWLQDNGLTGSIPPELGGLRNMSILQMQDNELSGGVPWQLGNLSGVSILRLSGNDLEGCLPPALEDISTNDFDDLGLPFCENNGRAPAPQGVSAAESDGAVTVTWTAVSGAGLYEVGYRVDGSGGDWAAGATTTGSTLDLTAADGLECDTSYEFRVRANGDGTVYAAGWSASSATVTERTGTCNNAPEFATTTLSFSVAENAATSTVVGTVTATDTDTGDTLSYSITAGNEDKAFAIGGGTGVITVAGALDHETTPSYTLTVQASDGGGGVATTTVEIAVTDVAEDASPAPSDLSVSLSGGVFTLTWSEVTGAESYEVQRRTDGDWTVLATTTATVATYTPGGGSACGTTYRFRVLAYGDGTTYAAVRGAASEPESVTTEPCNRAPAFAESNYSFSIPENATTTDAVGTVSATDPDADTVSYAIVGGNEGAGFTIGSGTGVIRVSGALDHATTPAYTLVVEARDDSDAVATTTVAIAVIEDSCDNGVAVPDPGDNAGLVADCTILLAVRDALAGTSTLEWSAFTDIEDWTGVELGGTPERVTRLWMWQLDLNGTVPPQLAQLTKLEDINLGTNRLTGTIPTELGGLSGLQRLTLSDNRLTGTIPTDSWAACPI